MYIDRNCKLQPPFEWPSCLFFPAVPLTFFAPYRPLILSLSPPPPQPQPPRSAEETAAYIFASLAGATIVTNASVSGLALRLRAAAEKALAQKQALAGDGKAAPEETAAAAIAAITAAPAERPQLEIRLKSLQMGACHVPLRLQHMHYSATEQKTVVQFVKTALVDWCNQLIAEAWVAAQAPVVAKAEATVDNDGSESGDATSQDRLVQALRGYRDQYATKRPAEMPRVLPEMVRICGILEGSIVLYYDVALAARPGAPPSLERVSRALVARMGDASQGMLDAALGVPTGRQLAKSNPLAPTVPPPATSALDFWTPEDKIDVALEQGQAGSLRELLDEADVDVDAPFAFARGGTLLHRAAAVSTDEAVLELLLARGAQLARTDNMGRLPLQVAVAHGNFVAVERLLRAHEATQWRDAAGNAITLRPAKVRA